MLLSQLHEISSIDSEISSLHERLDTLYRQRAVIANVKDSASSATSILADDSISLEGIDLSL